MPCEPGEQWRTPATEGARFGLCRVGDSCRGGGMGVSHAPPFGRFLAGSFHDHHKLRVTYEAGMGVRRGAVMRSTRHRSR